MAQRDAKCTRRNKNNNINFDEGGVSLEFQGVKPF